VATLQGYEQLQARLHAIGAGDTGLMKQIGTAVVRESQLLARPNKKTGNLIRQIRVTAATPTSVTVTAGAPYSGYVEFGTRGGTVITPKAARVLAWGGARRLTGSLRSGSKPTHFAMRVIRGATRAFPYLIPGAKRAIKGVGLDEIVKRWNGAA
jgi:hypothetical protein